MIILLVIAIVAVAAPIVGVLLVGQGIRREDAAFSLSRQPTGALQSATRRLLGFHGDGLGQQPAGQGGTGARLDREGWEGPAGRTVTDDTTAPPFSTTPFAKTPPLAGRR